MMSGKTLTEHITDLVINSLEEKNDIQNNESTAAEKIKDLEQRLLTVESTVRNREYVSEKLKPFTNLEAINCTKFMRGVFDKQLKKRDFDNKSEAFDEFFELVEGFDKLSKSFYHRLRDVMLSDKPTPWTGNELNEIAGNDKCNCSIRKGLISWTGVKECPSQQEICDKGEDLVSMF